MKTGLPGLKPCRKCLLPAALTLLMLLVALLPGAARATGSSFDYGPVEGVGVSDAGIDSISGVKDYFIHWESPIGYTGNEATGFVQMKRISGSFDMPVITFPLQVGFHEASMPVDPGETIEVGLTVFYATGQVSSTVSTGLLKNPMAAPVTADFAPDYAGSARYGSQMTVTATGTSMAPNITVDHTDAVTAGPGSTTGLTTTMDMTIVGTPGTSFTIACTTAETDRYLAGSTSRTFTVGKGLPLAPTGVQVSFDTGAGGNALTATYTPGTADYALYEQAARFEARLYDPDSGSYQVQSDAASAAIGSITFTNLNYGTTYDTLQVRAVDANGNASAWVSSAAFSYTPYNLAFDQAPPLSMRVGQSATVSFYANPDTDGAHLSLSADNAGLTLEKVSNYACKVTAVTAGVYGITLNAAKISNAPAASITAAVKVLPALPKPAGLSAMYNPSATNPGQGSVTLSWTAPAGIAAGDTLLGYTIFMNSNGEWGFIGVADAVATSFQDGMLGTNPPVVYGINARYETAAGEESTAVVAFNTVTPYLLNEIYISSVVPGMENPLYVGREIGLWVSCMAGAPVFTDVSNTTFSTSSSMESNGRMTVVVNPLAPGSVSLTFTSPDATIEDTYGSMTYKGTSKTFTATILDAPKPVGNLVVSGSGATAQVSFTEPAPVASYTLRTYTAFFDLIDTEGGVLAEGTGSPLSVSGLKPGATYRVYVTADYTNDFFTESSRVQYTAKNANTITFDHPGTQRMGINPRVQATSSSGLAVTLVSNNESICTLTPDGQGSWIVNLLAPGQASLTASQAGDGTYAKAADVTREFVVDPALPLPVVNSVVAGVGSFTVNFTLPVLPPGLTHGYALEAVSASSYGVSTGSGSPLIVSGLEPGLTYTLTLKGRYDAYSTDFILPLGDFMAKRANAITFPEITGLRVGDSQTVTLSSLSGVELSLLSEAWELCQVTPLGDNRFTLKFQSGGVIRLTASAPADDVYEKAEAILDVTVGKLENIITFNNPGTQYVGGSSYVDAGASSSLPIALESSDLGICTLAQSETGKWTMNFLKAGSVTVTASQAGNNTFEEAVKVAQTFDVKAAPPVLPELPKPVIVSLVPGGGHAGGSGGSVTLNFTLPALPEGFTHGYLLNAVPAGNQGGNRSVGGASGPLTLNGLLPGVTYTLTLYASYTPDNENIVGLPLGEYSYLNPNVIDFPAPGPQVVGQPAALTITASSGLAVTLVSSDESIVMVTDNGDGVFSLTFAAAGKVTLTASQAGDNTTEAAKAVSHVITVGPAPTPEPTAKPTPKPTPTRELVFINGQLSQEAEGRLRFDGAGSKYFDIRLNARGFEKALSAHAPGALVEAVYKFGADELSLQVPGSLLTQLVSRGDTLALVGENIALKLDLKELDVQALAKGAGLAEWTDGLVLKLVLRRVETGENLVAEAENLGLIPTGQAWRVDILLMKDGKSHPVNSLAVPARLHLPGVDASQLIYLNAKGEGSLLEALQAQAPAEPVDFFLLPGGGLVSPVRSVEPSP